MRSVVPNQFDGRRVTVMGLGRFGGGAGVSRWLVAQGANVTITDLQPEEELHDALADIRDLIAHARIGLRLGRHSIEDFAQSELVVANPAVPQPWQNTYIRAAMNAGVPVTTEIRLLCERINRKRVVGITGSAGKSTTSAMIHHILRNAGVRSHLGGNIGGTLLHELDSIQADDWIVLELSSAMLHWLGEGVGFAAAVGWSPHIAVLTNITPNHIDWHGSFDHYQQSKRNITRFQSIDRGDVNIAGDSLAPFKAAIRLRIPGKHNELNARMAIRAAHAAIGIDHDAAAELLEDFNGLPHRLQLIAEHDGLRFYNDSKSTTPQATLLAIASFGDESRVHLIAGGYDKGIDLSPIASAAERLGGLYTIGATGSHIAQKANASSADDCKTLDVAVERALNNMGEGDVLLLSPGCASWDQFDNYEQRGEEFVRLIELHARSSEMRTFVIPAKAGIQTARPNHRA